MNTTFFYGLILAVTNIVLTLIFFFAGYQTDKMAAGRWIVTIVPILGAIVVTWLGMKAVRLESKDQSLSYGRALGTGVLIAVYSGVIGAIYTFIHFTFVNPNFADYAVDFARQQWIAHGMGESQMEQAEKVTRFIYKPAMMACVTIVVSPIFGTLLSLIIAIFARRRPAVAAAPAEPVSPA